MPLDRTNIESFAKRPLEKLQLARTVLFDSFKLSMFVSKQNDVSLNFVRIEAGIKMIYFFSLLPRYQLVNIFPYFVLHDYTFNTF